MELQNKFEEILQSNSTCLLTKSSVMENPEQEDWLWSGEFKNVAKICTKLCLEEQMKLIRELRDKQMWYIADRMLLHDKIEELQQQLKDLKDGN